MAAQLEINRPVIAEITDIIRDVLGDSLIQLRPETAMDDIPGWDSMMQVTLLVEAEMRYGIKFRTGEIDMLGSVGDLIQAIETKRART
ncbi:MAG: acyl carrier protein [Acetobacteraceae bacterium]|nr:acyl carrier protein [Acetobacteraceae bacterium]